MDGPGTTTHAVLLTEFWDGRFDVGNATLNESARSHGVAVVGSKSLGPKSAKTRCNPAPAATDDAGAASLHLARSAPGLATALVGHKRRSHVDANLAVLREPPLSPAAFFAAVRACKARKQAPASRGN